MCTSNHKLLRRDHHHHFLALSLYLYMYFLLSIYPCSRVNGLFFLFCPKSFAHKSTRPLLLAYKIYNFFFILKHTINLNVIYVLNLPDSVSCCFFLHLNNVTVTRKLIRREKPILSNSWYAMHIIIFWKSNTIEHKIFKMRLNNSVDVTTTLIILDFPEFIWCWPRDKHLYMLKYLF